MKSQITLKTGLLSVGFVLGLVGCQVDPYPTNGVVTNEKPAEKRFVTPVYVLDAPRVMEFSEGESGEYDIQATVPDGGEPRVIFYNLPEGAAYDGAARKLRWKPNFDQGNDRENLTTITKEYQVKAIMTSSLNPLIAKEENFILLVRDVPRDMAINSSDITAKKVVEGQLFKQKIRIESDDFPDGPFRVRATGLPDGAFATIDQKNDPNVVVIEYNPLFRQVDSRRDQWDDVLQAYAKKITFDLIIDNPRGQGFTQPLTWTIVDSRQEPKLTVPSDVSQSFDVSINLTAEDPNGEVVPSVELVGYPKWGKTSINLVDQSASPGREFPSSVYNFSWTDLPPEALNQVQELTFRACVPNGAASRLCTNRKVSVKITGNLHRAPMIDRTQWPLGKVLYLKADTTISLPIKDAEFPLAFVKTVVSGPDAADVKWEKNSIKIKVSKEGMKQFDLTATSQFGIPARESFFYEVLPLQWGEVVLVGETLKNPDLSTADNMLDSAQLLNPALQTVDERLLSYRKGIYFGTHAIQSDLLLEEWSKISDKLKRVIIASPLLGQMHQSMVKRLEDLGITFAGQIGDPQVGGGIGLKDLSFVVAGNNGLATAKHRMKLDPTLTSESGRPMTLSLSNKSACQPMLNLEDETGTTKLLVSVLCPKSGGGYYYVSGFEWGAVKNSADDDKGVAKHWLNYGVKKDE